MPTATLAHTGFFRRVNRINYNYYDHHSFSVMLCKSPSALKRNKRSRVTKGRYNVRYWEVISRPSDWSLTKICSYNSFVRNALFSCRYKRGIGLDLFCEPSFSSIHYADMRVCGRGGEANAFRATCICEMVIFTVR